MVNIEHIVARPAVHGQQRIDAREHAAGDRGDRADVDDIVIIAAINCGMPGDRTDIDDVVATVAVDHCAALVGAFDREGIVS